MKIAEITDTDPMRSAMNRGLMVHWINADLIERAACDVRRSVVLYDADMIFMHALGADVGVSVLDPIADQLIGAGVRYYSIGVK